MKTLRIDDNRILKGSICLFVLSLLFQMFVSNQVAVKTRELSDLSERLVKVKTEISDVSQEIYLSSSLSALESKALSLGFVKMEGTLNTPAKPVMASAF